MYKHTENGNPLATGGHRHVRKFAVKKQTDGFNGINAQAGAGSSLRIQMDDMLPALFRTKEMARVELLLNHLSTQSYEILEVNLQVLEHVS